MNPSWHSHWQIYLVSKHMQIWWWIKMELPQQSTETNRNRLKSSKKKKKKTCRKDPDMWPKSVPFYLPAWAAPACSASPPLPHSCSSSDRSTEAPLPAGTETARARHQQAYAPAPPAIRPERAQARHQPAWSHGPRGVHSQSLLPSP